MYNIMFITINVITNYNNIKASTYAVTRIICRGLSGGIIVIYSFFVSVK